MFAVLPVRDDEPSRLFSGRPSVVVVPLVLALILGVGLARRGQQEIYPFATWAMFSRVPETIGVWTLRIHSVDGEMAAEELLVREHPVFADAFTSGSAYRRVDRYGRALLAVQNGHEREELDQLRDRVEELFGDHSVVYRVVHLRGDPLELVRGTGIERELNLGLFETG